jgi:hypothetical protein
MTALPNQHPATIGAVVSRLTVLCYSAAMTEDDFLRALPLADRLRVAAVDLALTGAPRALVAAVWWASEEAAGGAARISVRRSGLLRT